MTVNGVCHTRWEDNVHHICGRNAGHGNWHQCPCGAVLLQGGSNLTEEARKLRERDCPECLARTGRPCHTTDGAVMSGVHASRAKP